MMRRCAPQTRYTFWRNTASIMKGLVFGLCLYSAIIFDYSITADCLLKCASLYRICHSFTTTLGICLLLVQKPLQVPFGGLYFTYLSIQKFSKKCIKKLKKLLVRLSCVNYQHSDFNQQRLRKLFCDLFKVKQTMFLLNYYAIEKS